jgi:hypothetical protein
MRKTLFIAGAIALGFLSPAFADDSSGPIGSEQNLGGEPPATSEGEAQSHNNQSRMRSSGHGTDMTPSADKQPHDKNSR